MKRKIIYIFSLVICLCFLSNIVYAASPPATLTIDGVPAGTFPSVQAAVDEIDAQPGTNFIVEIAEGTVTDPLDILQLPNKNVVIRPQAGANVVLTNTITIDGNGHLDHPETLLIEGLTFDFSAGTPPNCIYFNLLPGRVGLCYPHNVTINGCTFKGVFNQVVALQSITGGSRNIAIMNCKATDMHSLAQFKAVSGFALVQNCTLSNSMEGVNFYGPGDLIVDSCKLDATMYAVRSGQSAGGVTSPGSVIINNSILNSNSAANGTVILRSDTALNINILHSNISNENPAGPVIQNLNPANEDLYNLKIVESNVPGTIAGINLTTITTIDDPNVPNGPVCVSQNGGNGYDCRFIYLIGFIIIGLLFLLVIICAVRKKKHHPWCLCKIFRKKRG